MDAGLVSLLVGEILPRVATIAVAIAGGVTFANLLVAFGAIDYIGIVSKPLTRPANLPDEVGSAILTTGASTSWRSSSLIPSLDSISSTSTSRGTFLSSPVGHGPPKTSMYEMLENGDNIWIAPMDQITPHLEVKFTRDEFDRASLEHGITARIGGEAVPIGPLELQIAYKLHLGAQKDIEDAVHLYTLFEESLSVPRLENWVRRLDVEDEYERLKRA